MQSDDLKRICDAFDQIGKALVSFAEDCGKLLKVFTDCLRDAAGAVCKIFPDLIPVSADDLKEKTRPPRKPVKQLGCRPKTMIYNRREFRVQRR